MIWDLNLYSGIFQLRVNRSNPFYLIFMRISKDDQICIIGGGIAGLVTAIALRHYGFSEVSVFFQKADKTNTGSVVHISANALNALTSVNMSERVFLEGVPWKQREYRFKNNKVFKTLDMGDIKEEVGFPPVSVRLEDLLDLFKRELPANSLIEGEDFISYTEHSKHVEAHFSSGLAESAVMLIGADGIHSRVRLQMRGESPLNTSNRKVFWGSFLPKEDMQELITDNEKIFKEPYTEFIGDGRSISLFSFSGNEIHCYVNISSENYPENVDTTSHLMGLFKQFPKIVTESLEKIPYSNWKELEMTDRKIPKGWYNGRIVLVGRSIHPSLPISHEGVGMDIESGVLLARLLAEQLNMKKAFKAFEKKRRSRVRISSKMGRKMERRLYWKNPVALFLRNQFPDIFPDPTVASPFTKLNHTHYY